MSRLTLTLALALCLVPAMHARAQLAINDPDPARHHRFYEGEDRNFYLEGFDFSGVGRGVSSATWAVMIAPNVFLTADHFKPGTNETIRFYHDNDPNGAFEERIVAGGSVIPGTDLYVGRLNLAVSDEVKTYDIVAGEDNDGGKLFGEKLLMFGRFDGSTDPTSQAIGRNTAMPFDADQIWFANADAPEVHNSLGQDEAWAVAGDSGAPGFVLVENELALVFTHFSPTNATSVPHLLDEVSALVDQFTNGFGEVSVVNIPDQRIAPVLAEDFQADTLGNAPEARHKLTAYVGTQDGGVAGSVSVVSDPGLFAGAGNQVLKMSADDAEHTTEAFFEGLATALNTGYVGITSHITAATTSLDATIMRLWAGDDRGSQTFNELTGTNAESVFRIELAADGTIRFVTAGGITLTADQQFQQDEVLDWQIHFDTEADDPFYSVTLNGQALTADGGAVDQFSLLSDVGRLDAILLETLGVTGGTTAYFDDLLISPVPVPEPVSLVVFALAGPMVLTRSMNKERLLS